MRIVLIVKTGPHAGHEFAFDGHDNFIVGRSKSAQFRPPSKDEFFSRNHFLVEVNPPLCRLLDLNSTNGTNVNGQRIKSIELKDGDSIEAGETTLQVRIIPDEASALMSETAEQTPPPLLEVGREETNPHSTRPHIELPSTVIALQSSDANSSRPAFEAKIAARPQPFPDYEIIDELGRGAMGVVYRARIKTTGELVALKVVLPAAASSTKDIARFLREANIVKQFDHPHIVRFRGLGQVDRQIYFAMDLVPGIDGQALLRREGGPLPVARAIGIVVQLLEGLAVAHQSGYVHRDVKPANMLIEERPTGDFVRLSDFGLARVYLASVISGLTTTGTIGGTLPFMAPEQITNFRGVGPAADQYSAAATLYYLLTRKYPYDLPKDTAQRLLKVLQEPPCPIESRRSDLPRKLAIVINKALARLPVERFLDVNAFRLALESCVR